MIPYKNYIIAESDSHSRAFPFDVLSLWPNGEHALVHKAESLIEARDWVDEREPDVKPLNDPEKKMIALALFRTGMTVKEVDAMVTYQAISQICVKIGASGALQEYAKQYLNYHNQLEKIINK
jgi:hypothetical protein